MSFTLRQQRTIARAVSVDGFGYWSGKDVRVEFRPAAADRGLVFVRSDLPKPVRIPALVQNRVDVQRRTTLAAGDTIVEMVEHVMAALAGMRIDNCEIWVDRPEMPGFDGSSQAFIEAILRAGITLQGVPRRQCVIHDVFRVGNSESWVEARPCETADLRIQYQLDYGPNNPIGHQEIQLEVTPETFRSELASSRTFLLQQEAEWLRSQGLGQRVTYDDLLVFDDQGPVSNALRFPDECVRHKALDLVGDLALAGCDLVGYFVACRSGHRLNAELVRALVADRRCLIERRQSA
ncbi:MAG: UDP-3-O-acyl-N-acetylglucosamine deacetylase [Pirellulaceae bacterium]